MRASVNIRDVARLAGVGVSTVSRVINGHPDVNEDTRRLVQKVIEENNYVPNNAARNLKRRASKSVGVLIKGISNPFFGEMVRIIENRLDGAGYTMILQQVESSLDEIDAAIELTQEKRLTGLIFLGGQFEQTHEKLGLLKVPFVLVTITLFGAVDRTRFSSVTVDDAREAQRAVEYLCGLGHRRIAVITGGIDDRSIARLRLEGYRRALAARGIAYDERLVQYTDRFEMQAGYDRTVRLLEDGARFTALFAVSDTVAVGACRALLERGIKIPRDVSVMGFDGQDIASFYTPSITTIRQPAEELARRGVGLLLDAVERGEGNRHLVFEAELVEGESCAPPPLH